MLERFFGFNFDFAGAATAAICAIHCTAFPILLSLGLVSSTAHSHTFDWVLMTIGVCIAGYILIKDFSTKHRNSTPLIMAVVGFTLLFIGIETHGHHFYLNIIGGILIVLSHISNWKASRLCPTF